MNNIEDLEIKYWNSFINGNFVEALKRNKIYFNELLKILDKSNYEERFELNLELGELLGERNYILTQLNKPEESK